MIGVRLSRNIPLHILMYLCQESMLIAKRKQNLLFFVASRLYFNYCCSMRSFDNYKITLNKIKINKKEKLWQVFFIILILKIDSVLFLFK